MLDLNSYEDEIFDLSFIAKSKFDTNHIREVITELKCLKDNVINSDDYSRIDELILSYYIYLKEAQNQDYSEEYRRLEKLLSINK